MVKAKVKRTFFFIAGVTSFIAGIIGAFLPIVPTVPFILLAAYCFSKSSQRIHDWMINHPHMGPYIISWREHGMIPLKVKYFVSVVIPISFGSTILFVKVHYIIKILVALIGVGVIAFVWSRPHQVKG